MKRLYVFVFGLLLSVNLYGQDFDRVMTRKVVDCSDISYNSGSYFIKYMQEGKLDSAKYLLQYWESRCGIREPIFRAKLLLALSQNQFNDSLLTAGTLNHIYNYQNRMSMIKYSNFYAYDNYSSYYSFIPPGQEFDRYTKELSADLLKKFNPGQMEYLLTEFYGVNSDTIFTSIQDSAYNRSVLAMQYDQEVKRYLALPEYHMAWITGVWIPTGGIKKLGVHPELGFLVGVKHKKMNYDLIMAFKFANTPNAYYARRTKLDNSLELTNHFFGGHIGLDIGRDIYAKKGHELQLAAGVAFDGFDALKEDKGLGIESESTSTYDFNFGLGYRYYLTNTLYLGLRARYHIVDYSRNNVVDFNGYPITIQFIVGGVNNAFRNNNLKALKYRLRR